MKDKYITLLNEIRETLKTIADGQEQLIMAIKELREEQKELYDEIRINNSTIYNFPTRTEIIN